MKDFIISKRRAIYGRIDASFKNWFSLKSLRSSVFVFGNNATILQNIIEK